jgi:iron complex outermembrane recepter protein
MLRLILGSSLHQDFSGTRPIFGRMSILRGLVSLAPLSFTFTTPCIAAAPNPIEIIVVTGRVSADVRTIEGSNIDAATTFTVADSLERNVPSAMLSDTEGNLFQPDLYFRGFDASPVLGTAEGLAVYQGGTRINQAFGGTVLWDLVPTFAIAKIDVVTGSDPIFGLNALGGAVTLRMKTGIDFKASEVAASVGSFGRVKVIGQAGGVDGDTAFYVGASAVHDDGWRRSSPSDLLQAYGNYSVRNGQASADVSLTIAEDWLNENAAIPVQDMPTAAFSIPDTARDRVVFLQGRAEYDWSPNLKILTAGYFRWTQVSSTNGQASGFVACSSDPTLLCASDDPSDPLTSSGRDTIPSSLGGNATLGLQTTDTKAIGATAELDLSDTILGFDNDVRFGVAFDYAPSSFSSLTELGNLTFQPGGVTSVPVGVFVDGPSFAVSLDTTNVDAAVYVQDTLSLASSLTMQLSGRFNEDRIRLSDRLGTALSGKHVYSGINPAIGLSWQVGNHLSAYVRFGQSSRTPTAAELSCADPASPCLFPISFISDPNLQKVVAQTFELGATAQFVVGELSGAWTADAYSARNQHDILFVSSGSTIGSGYFTNVGATERRGVEASLDLNWRDLDVHVSYAYVDATFRSAFSLSSPFNPGADANGNIFVSRGDQLPNIPHQLGKLVVGYQVTPELHLSLDARLVSEQFLRGDEANLQKPLAGYTVFGAEAEYQLTRSVGLYLSAQNLFDRHYATFGLYSDPTGNGALPQFTDPRFIVPAEPFALSAGIHLAF